jgi:hypothetical protein
VATGWRRSPFAAALFSGAACFPDVDFVDGADRFDVLFFADFFAVDFFAGLLPVDLLPAFFFALLRLVAIVSSPGFN